MCEVDIRQMRHCRQCRADAIGLLDKDRSAEFAHFTCGGERARKGEPVGLEMEGQTIYRIAVATKEGRVVDLHFGHAEEFWTFTVEGRSITPGQKISVVEQQEIPLFGPGHRTKLESTVEALRASMRLATNMVTGTRLPRELDNPIAIPASHGGSDKTGIPVYKESGDVQVGTS